MKVKTALVSVSDKTELEYLVKGLLSLGIEIISTGGTAKKIQEYGLNVKEISELTRFPEMLEGRVKSLHPHVFAGVLAKRNEKHLSQLQSREIQTIDLVVCNLYPFSETVAKKGSAHEDIIENIDIGGPSLIRAAAKNYRYVGVVTDPADYPRLIDSLRRESCKLNQKTLQELATKAFQYTSDYERAIYNYFAGLEKKNADKELFPQTLEFKCDKVADLRYGENPHQKAALYRDQNYKGVTLLNSQQLNGKDLSYNNLGDSDAALEILREFNEPTVVAVKHANPCGVASGNSISEATRLAIEADSVSVFGGIIACNRPVTLEMALLFEKIFLEVILAPGFHSEALRLLQKKPSLRLLQVPGIESSTIINGSTFKEIAGGVLVQDRDVKSDDISRAEIVAGAELAGDICDDLAFAWKVVKHVKSNAIVVAKNKQTLGIGAGQTNRIDAARHALARAGKNAKGAVLASDAFFPFDDVAKASVEAGIAGIIQPGGSIRDSDSIKVLDEAGIPMLFTGVRHFRH